MKSRNASNYHSCYVFIQCNSFKQSQGNLNVQIAELCRHLFLSFIKRTAPRQSSSPMSSCGNFPDGKVMKVSRIQLLFFIFSIFASQNFPEFHFHFSNCQVIANIGIA